MPEAIHVYAVAFGSNRPHGHFGAPQRVLEEAIARMDRDFDLFAASPIILNPAMGTGLRDFANAMAVVESPLDPPAMLRVLKAIEREFGRRPGKRWAPRVLDLDIAAWSGGRWRSRALTLPHKGMKERSFVLGPLAAIAPGWRLEGHLTARHLAARLARRRPRG